MVLMRALSLSILLLLPGCKLPDVNLATPKPIEMNLNMRLDVYQYSGDAPSDKETAKEQANLAERQRNRSEEIQTLKNNRLVGENHLGLLQTRDLPAGKWGEYVKKTVEEENADRLSLMRKEAEKTERSLNLVQAEQWKLRSEKAFKGEFIELPDTKPETYRWVQAEGPVQKIAPAEKPTSPVPAIPLTAP
jgi:hypothetical protein